ncbi:MAG: purine-nucleoside phosphorylase [Actinomycetota bacterium]
MSGPEPFVVPGPGDRLDEEAVALIRERTDVAPTFAVILGSGLSGAASCMDIDVELSFEGIPGFPPPTSPGHPGRFLAGSIDGIPAAMFAGRIHYYEGHPLALCSLPVRLSASLLAHTLVVTASVGGLDPALETGTIVVASDHLNLLGDNPVRGWHRPDGTPAFVDLGEVYDRDLADRAEKAARDLGLEVSRGVYAAVPGPSYETPAEIELLRRAGGSVVGMSVVPETVPARALGMRVLGLFVVTNALGGPELSHTDVVRIGEERAGDLGRLLTRLAAELGSAPERTEGAG